MASNVLQNKMDSNNPNPSQALGIFRYGLFALTAVVWVLALGQLLQMRDLKPTVVFGLLIVPTMILVNTIAGTFNWRGKTAIIWEVLSWGSTIFACIYLFWTRHS